jgi:hypothetical protein
VVKRLRLLLRASVLFSAATAAASTLEGKD